MNLRFLPLLLTLLFVLSGCGSSGRTAADVMNSTEPSVELSPLKEDEEHTIASESGEVEAEEDSVGLMAFYPNGSGALSALAGMNTFTFYFENPDVEVNEGRIGLYDADAESDPLCAVVDVTDESRVKVLPIDENGVNISNFEHGCMAVISFDWQYEPNKNYYILMDNNCFKRGDITSVGIANASYITFSTKPYGIKGKLEREYGVGETETFEVILGGEADAAGMSDYNSTILSFSPITLNESGEEMILFNKRTDEDMPASCTLKFLSDGHAIDSCTFYFDIVDKPTDVDMHSALSDETTAHGAVPDDNGDVPEVGDAGD